MSKPYSVNLLPLLVIALSILSLCFISAATPSSTLSNQEIDQVIEALVCPHTYEDQEGLVCQSDFTIWAKFLAASKTRHLLPVNATMFVPTDAAISPLRYATDMDSSYLIPYHITPEHRFLFSDLCHLEPLSLLPTLIPSKAILVTSTLPSSYKVDNAIITHPNIYLSSNIAVHGINRILDLNPQRSSMPPLLYAGNVLAPTGSRIAPVAAPVGA